MLFKAYANAQTRVTEADANTDRAVTLPLLTEVSDERHHQRHGQAHCKEVQEDQRQDGLLVRHPLGSGVAGLASSLHLVGPRPGPDPSLSRSILEGSQSPLNSSLCRLSSRRASVSASVTPPPPSPSDKLPGVCSSWLGVLLCLLGSRGSIDPPPSRDDELSRTISKGAPAMDRCSRTWAGRGENAAGASGPQPRRRRTPNGTRFRPRPQQTRGSGHAVLVLGIPLLDGPGGLVGRKHLTYKGARSFSDRGASLHLFGIPINPNGMQMQGFVCLEALYFVYEIALTA